MNPKEEYKPVGKLSDYEESCMWMSYRYCIGRHTIASHAHAEDIAKYCYGRLEYDRSWFVSYDINRSIQDSMSLMGTGLWIFPIRNTYAITGIDAFCEFVTREGSDLEKYRKIRVKYEEGSSEYHFDPELWSDYIYNQLIPFLKDRSKEYILDFYEEWVKGNKKDIVNDELKITLGYIKRQKDSNSVSTNYDDLFVWNNLAHLFDIGSHHKSILMDNTESEWYWSWRKGYGKTYEKVRIPVRYGCSERWSLPDESILKDIY